MKLTAEKILPGGDCLARLNGKAVFVSGALPGEVVEATIHQDKKDYARASVNEVLEPSPHRVTPRCPYFGRCGGCSLQYANDGHQTELRRSILVEAMGRFRVATSAEVTVVTGTHWEYRSRFQFRQCEGGIGLMEASTNRTVIIEDCPIAVPELREAIRSGSIARNTPIIPRGPRFHAFGWGGKVWVEGDDSLAEVSISGASIRFDVKGFFQSNIGQLTSLIAALKGHLSQALVDETFLDLYSGVGTFAVTLGHEASGVHLVEHNRHALEAARGNCARSKISAFYHPMSDDAWALSKESRIRFGAAIVDPPRSGLSRAALDWLGRSGIPRVAYVSCDPVTFSRDAALLIAAGYSLEDVTLFDFYPQTCHVETLGIFSL
jgi:23S rRNA (uracil1939-C5)-methyltransferase